MRKLLVGLTFAIVATGCHVHGRGHMHVRGPNPFAVVATAVAVGAIVAAVSTPPPAVVHVEYYDYGHRPGHIWVNGRYTYVNNQWVWNAGYWQPERSGHYWVQGSWQPRGNQYVWVDGYWAEPRSGYIYVDGYWDYRDTGYVWTPGYWETDRPGHVYVSGSYTVVGGRRSYTRGRWEVDDGRPDYGVYRTRYHSHRSTTHVRGGGGGPVIRDHR
jgi:hypothetical protein